MNFNFVNLKFAEINTQPYGTFHVGTDCGQPPSIANGMITNITSTKVNGVTFYRCVSGYQLEGTNNQLMCDTSGDWVVKRPVCNGKQFCATLKVLVTSLQI